MGQLGGAERRAVDPVTAGAAADRHNQVVRVGLFERFIDRDQTDVSAVNQRVSEVALVEEYRAVDGRDPHAVSVVTHAGHDAAHDPFRVKNALRKIFERNFRRSEAENVRVGDRLGAHSCPHRVTDDAADPRVGAAVGLQRGRVIVRFHLEADVVLVVERHDARIILEDAHAPVFFAEVFADLLCRGENRFLQHILEDDLLLAVPVRNAAGQGFVGAVLAPGLRDGFQLDVGRVAVQLLEVLLDRLHLDQREVKLAFEREGFQLVVVHRADRDDHEVEVVRTADFEVLERERAFHDLLDRVVGEDLPAQFVDLGGIKARDEELAERADGGDRLVHFLHGFQGRIGDRVHDAGFGQNVQEDLAVFGVFCVADRENHRVLNHAVGQKLTRDFRGLRLVQLALEQVAVAGADLHGSGSQTESLRLGQNFVRQRIDLTGFRININFPKHFDSRSKKGN